jgi:hypothetical protein
VDSLLKQLLDPNGTAALARALKASARLDTPVDAQLTSIAEHLRALAGETVRLRAALAVAVEALERAGTLDAQRAAARMRELMLLGDENTAVAATPIMTPPKPPVDTPPRRSDSVFECQRCKKVVPALDSYVTSQGTFCATCYAAAPG